MAAGFQQGFEALVLVEILVLAKDFNPAPGCCAVRAKHNSTSAWGMALCIGQGLLWLRQSLQMIANSTLWFASFHPQVMRVEQLAVVPSDGGMIKKTFLVVFSSILLVVFGVGCSSENTGSKNSPKVAVEQVQGESASSAVLAHDAASNLTYGADVDSVDGMSGAALTQKGEKALSKKYDPNKEYGSLWQSDLFADDRFQMKIKLTALEKKEAKVLARSFESHMERSKMFMHYLLSELQERNMPAELAALPLVESGFNLRARSHAGAHGPWQFTRQTGKSFGLEVSANYDEFYDFVASTEASLNYLQHLKKELKSWDLAIIAYNQGEFGVKKAIRRAKLAGVKDISASTIPLTKMGRTYLKRVRAYADILHNPQKYGVEHPAIENRAAFKRVQTAGRINSMREAAKLSGADLDTLKILNAGYLSDSLKSRKERGLLVPVEYAGRLEQALGIFNPTNDKVHELSHVDLQDATKKVN